MPPVRVLKESGASRSSPSIDGVSLSLSPPPHARKTGMSYRDVLVRSVSPNDSAVTDGSVRPGSVATRGRLSYSTTLRTEGVIPVSLVVAGTTQPSTPEASVASAAEPENSTQSSGMFGMAPQFSDGNISPTLTSEAATTSKKSLFTQGTRVQKTGLRGTKKGGHIMVSQLSTKSSPVTVSEDQRRRRVKTKSRPVIETSFVPIAGDSAPSLESNSQPDPSPTPLGSDNVDGVRRSHRMALAKSDSDAENLSSDLAEDVRSSSRLSESSPRVTSAESDTSIEPMLRQRALSAVSEAQSRMGGPPALKSVLSKSGRRRKRTISKRLSWNDRDHSPSVGFYDTAPENPSPLCNSTDGSESDVPGSRTRGRPRFTSPDGRAKSTHQEQSADITRRNLSPDGRAKPSHHDSSSKAVNLHSSLNVRAKPYIREGPTATIFTSKSHDGRAKSSHRHRSYSPGQFSKASVGRAKSTHHATSYDSGHHSKLPSGRAKSSHHGSSSNTVQQGDPSTGRAKSIQCKPFSIADYHGDSWEERINSIDPSTAGAQVNRLSYAEARAKFAHSNPAQKQSESTAGRYVLAHNRDSSRTPSPSLATSDSSDDDRPRYNQGDGTFDAPYIVTGDSDRDQSQSSGRRQSSRKPQRTQSSKYTEDRSKTESLEAISSMDIRQNPAAFSKEGMSIDEIHQYPGKYQIFRRSANQFYNTNHRIARYRLRANGPKGCYIPNGNKVTTIVDRTTEPNSVWDLIFSSDSSSSSSSTSSSSEDELRDSVVRSKHQHSSSDDDETSGPSRKARRTRGSDPVVSSSRAGYDQQLDHSIKNYSSVRSAEESTSIRDELLRQRRHLKELFRRTQNKFTTSDHKRSSGKVEAEDKATQPPPVGVGSDRIKSSAVSNVQVSSTTHSSSRPSGNITQLGIEPFTGYNCNDVPEWFRRYVIAVRAVRADPLEVFPLYCSPDVYRYLELCVTGFPNADMVSESRPSHVVWADLQKIVLAQYAVSRDSAALEKELLERNQRIGESVGEFASTISLMAAKMQPPWSPDRIKSTFFSLMNKRICAKFNKLSGSESLQWIVEQARHWENQILCEDEEKRAQEATGNLFAMSYREQQAPLEEGELPDRHHLAAFNSRAASSRSRNPNVMALGFKSDSSGRGRAPYRKYAGRSRFGARPQPSDPSIRCMHCGIIGHRSTECRKKSYGMPPSIRKDEKTPLGVKLCSIASKQSALIAGFVRSVNRAYEYTPMLVDSGADANFATVKFVSSLGLKISPDNAIEYVDGSNTKCKSIGTVSLSLRLHHRVYFKADFQVISSCPFDVILGPALAIPRAVFDFHSRALVFPGNLSLPTVDAYPTELFDLPLGHPKLAAFFAGGDEDQDPDFMRDSHITNVLESPTTEEIKARALPGGTAPKCKPTINPDLSPKDYAKMEVFIEEYLAKGLWDEPVSTDAERLTRPLFRIELKPGAVPVWSPMGRVRIHHAPILEEHIQVLLENDLIERSTSEWSASMLVIEQKNKVRPVCNLKPVNAQTIIPKFEGTDLHDIIDNLGGCEYNSQGDLFKAYHQFGVHPDDRHLTAFSTPSGHYQWKVMPFGAAGAPAWFNKWMSIVLAGVPHTWSFFDDISTGTKAIPGRDGIDVHIEALRAQFDALLKSSLRLSPAKCFYAFKKINVLGFEVRAGEGVTLQEHKVEAITKMLAPTDKTGLRSFLGAIQVYSKFIPMLAEKTQPLTELLKGTTKGKLPEWLDVHQEAFQWAKDQLVGKPMLRYPDRFRRFKVYTDASTSAVGGVLQQEDDQGDLRPIMFTSRKLTPTESRYTTQEIECLGMMRCLTAFTNYLLGAEFDLYTDHQALLNIKVTKSPSARIQRWSDCIQHFDFIVHHKPGRLHVVADWLSRADIPDGPTRFTSLLALRRIPDPNLSDRNVWLQAQARDDFCQVVIRSIQDGTITNKQFALDSDGLLYHKEFHTEALQIVVPVILQDQILKMCHSDPTAAHAGVKRTGSRLSLSFFWVDWKHAVIHHVKACEQCQQLLIPKRRDSFIKATPRPVVAFRFNELVSIDIQGPFVPTSLGNVYVLNMTDICTHFSASLPMANTTALCVVSTFLNSWVQFFGAPQKACTDNGSNFTSALFDEFMEILSTRTIRTTPYHPQANPVERFGRTLNAAIAKFVAFNQMDWDQYLGLVNYAYNTSVHSVTGEIPATAVFKIAPTTLLEFIHMLPIGLELRTKWAIRGRKVMESALEQCRNVAFDRVKKASADINLLNGAEEPFGPGDIVWLTDRQGLRDGRKAKHTLRHSGPYRVLTINGQYSYWIQHVHTGARYRVHYHHLTLAPEPTQQKYRPGGYARGGEGSEAVELVSPAYPQPIDLPTTDTMVELPSSESVSVTELPVVDPFLPSDYSNATYTSGSDGSGGITQHTNAFSTNTTRSGRVVTVPVRYLNMFRMFQQTRSSLCPVAGEREEARM